MPGLRDAVNWIGRRVRPPYFPRGEMNEAELQAMAAVLNAPLADQRIDEAEVGDEEYDGLKPWTTGKVEEKFDDLAAGDGPGILLETPGRRMANREFLLNQAKTEAIREASARFTRIYGGGFSEETQELFGKAVKNYLASEEFGDLDGDGDYNPTWRSGVADPEVYTITRSTVEEFF